VLLGAGSGYRLGERAHGGLEAGVGGRDARVGGLEARMEAGFAEQRVRLARLESAVLAHSGEHPSSTRRPTLPESMPSRHERAKASHRFGGRMRRTACYVAFVLALLCEAIETKKLLAFTYEGHARVVVPYCHGFTRAGDEVLRGVQLRGSSRSGTYKSGKLWTVSKMRLVRTLDEGFVADDPDYEPNDSAMARVHCRI
jgi:hypothetical protein